MGGRPAGHQRHRPRAEIRWPRTDAAREIYDPKNTLFNHFVRGAAKGVWVGLFEVLVQAGGPPAQVLIDPSVVSAHRCAAEGE